MSRATEEVVAAVAQRDPMVVALAEELSLAARVDRPLLRRARRELRAPVEVEATLWFSSLVATRSVTGFTFGPAVVAVLRERLARRGGVERAWTRTKELHAHLPAALRLEEELTWRSLAGHPRELVEEALRPAVRAIRDPSREGLELWARRMLRYAPDAVTGTPTARLLDREVALIDAGAPRGGDGDWTERVEHAGEVTTALRIAGDELELGALSNYHGADYVTVTESRPNLVEVRWDGEDGASHSRLVNWSPSRSTVVQGIRLPLTLRFADGRGLRLRDAVAEEREWIAQVEALGHEWTGFASILRDRGYITDPQITTATEIREALRRFQQDHGLRVDGLPGPDTMALLQPVAEDASSEGGPIVIVHHERDRQWAAYLERQLAYAMRPARLLRPAEVGEDEAQSSLRDDEHVLFVASPVFFGSAPARRLLQSRTESAPRSTGLLLLPNAPPPTSFRVSTARLEPRNEARDLGRALADVGLDVELVDPPPPLPPHVDGELEELVFQMLIDATRSGLPVVPGVVEEDASEEITVAAAWATALEGRTPENAVVAVASHVGQHLLSRQRHRVAAMVASRRGIEAWARFGRRELVIDFQGLGLVSMAFREALRAGRREWWSLRDFLREHMDEVPPLDRAVLHLPDETPSFPFEWMSHGPLIRANPAFLEPRAPVRSEGGHFLVLGGAPGSRMLNLEPRQLSTVRDMRDVWGRTTPRLLAVDVGGDLDGPEGIEAVIATLPSCVRDGLVLIRVVLTDASLRWPSELPWFLPQVAAFCQARGPDTVILRIVNEHAGNALEADLLGLLSSGMTVGQALEQVWGKDPFPWFVWSDPSLTVEGIASEWSSREDRPR